VSIARSGALLVLLLAAPAAYSSTLWHVDAAAPCPGAGTMAAPFCSVQAALGAAAPGDEIVVAPGLYPERLDFLGKDVLLRSSAGPAATVVDAGMLGSVVTFAHGEGPGAVLRGFTLRNGTGTETAAPWPVLAGGGVYCRGASPTIEGNVVEQNGSDLGGGLAFFGGAATASGNTVRDNSALRGAGVLCAAGSVVRLVGNTIVSNGFLGNDGGGISVEDAGPSIEGNLVEDNTSAWGAGIDISTTLPAVVRGNTIRGNHTDEDEAGGLCVWPGPAVLVEDNEISGNSAHGNGAGLYAIDGTYRHNRITGNWGGDYSSVIAGDGASFDGDLIADNHAKLLVVGSARFTRVTMTGAPGVAVLVLDGQPSFDDCLIADNVEGVEVDDTGVVATLRRCTFAGNQYSAVVTWGGGRAVLGSCIAWGNALGTGQELAPETGVIEASWSIVRLGYPGEGNLDADPLFVAAAAGDYALLPGSPAIDSGDPADGVCGFDLSGMPRRLDGLLDGGCRVDRGALEFGNGRLALSAPQAGVLRIELVGTAGLSSALLAGVAPGPSCLDKWGTLGLDLAAPNLVLPWMPLPSAVPVRVPPSASGFPVVMQGLVGPPGLATGNFTNVETMQLP